MDRPTRTALALALWIVPLVLGMAFTSWIVTPVPPKETKNQPVTDSVQDDRDRLQGTWIGVSLERDGRVVYRGAEARKARVSFVGSSAVFEDPGATLVGTFTLNPTRAPKTFDLTVTEGGEQETYPAGIYELSADTFRLCFAFPTVERPTEFDTYPGSGRTLFVYQRADLGPRASAKARIRFSSVLTPGIRDRRLMTSEDNCCIVVKNSAGRWSDGPHRCSSRWRP